MVVIYAQEGTYLRSDMLDALDVLDEVYGPKLAQDAYNKLKDAPVGFSFRKNGGALVKIVSKQQAEEIRQKERAIGMLVE